MQTSATRNIKNIIWLILLVIATVWIVATHQRRTDTWHTDQGSIFGTIYHITYYHNTSLQQCIDSVLQRFDGSLSPFNDTSAITKINRNESMKADTLLANVIRKSLQISAQTRGAFDITVAPLVNAYGFGFESQSFPNPSVLDSLKQFVGYSKVHITSQDSILKEDPRLKLDCSAIAKGYAVDVTAAFLRRQGVNNFMVEIGGEVAVGGHNPDGAPWHIGVNKPVDDSLSINQDLQAVLRISSGGIATSGNYRNFYYRNGVKYAHTIDPRTALPARHSLLSATVIAPDCMTADALATAFMVMGLDSAHAMADTLNEVDAYFIYADSAGYMRTAATTGMTKFLTEQKRNRTNN